MHRIHKNFVSNFKTMKHLPLYFLHKIENQVPFIFMYIPVVDVWGQPLAWL